MSVWRQREVMYIPKHFEITEENEIYSFIEANAFGQLISNSQGRLCSTHLPFLLSEDKTTLHCHLAKQNPQIADIGDQDVLVTFQGAHDYISPSWYQSAGVPTWNYQAVHIYGKCRLISDTSELKRIVETLTSRYEARYPAPWKPEYAENMLNGIVGVDVQITEVQCKFKLSQNRSTADQAQVIEQLRVGGSEQLAKAMEQNETR